MRNESAFAPAKTEFALNSFKDFLLAHGAADRAHSGGNLWSHLYGVYALLQRNGQNNDVCAAGLFHSVYGTRSFKSVTLEKSQRHAVIAQIGSKAEALVIAFCELPRPQLFEQALAENATPHELQAYISDYEAVSRLSAETVQTLIQKFYQDLLAIECANLIEQRVLHPFPRLAHYAQTIGMLDREGFPI